MNIQKEQTHLYKEYGKEVYLKLTKDHRKMLISLLKNNVLKTASKIYYFSNKVDVYDYTILKDLFDFDMIEFLPEELLLTPSFNQKEVCIRGLTPRLTDYGISICKCLNLDSKKSLTGHNKLLYAFMNKLIKDDLLVVGDIEIKTEAGKSRPDILTINKTLNVSKMNPTAYEIKHSRADFLSDVKNESKRKSYLEVADKMYYVCDEGLIKKEEVPEGCGLIYPVYNCNEIIYFKIIKKAKVNKVEIKPELLMKMLLRVADVNNTILISKKN